MNLARSKSLIALLLTAATAAIASAAEKPNIVLILADDVSTDMFSCYGQPGTARTPNIDGLAKTGVRFTPADIKGILAAGHAGDVAIEPPHKRLDEHLDDARRGSRPAQPGNGRVGIAPDRRPDTPRERQRQRS